MAKTSQTTAGHYNGGLFSSKDVKNRKRLDGRVAAMWTKLFWRKRYCPMGTGASLVAKDA
eukprot:11319813-Prorocentrum_lima.AAC.1